MERTNKAIADRNVSLFFIAAKMNKFRLSNEFISKAVKTAMEFDCVYDLMILWRDEKSTDERYKIVQEIIETVADCAKWDSRVRNEFDANTVEPIRRVEYDANSASGVVSPARFSLVFMISRCYLCSGLIKYTKDNNGVCQNCKAEYNYINSHVDGTK